MVFGYLCDWAALQGLEMAVSCRYPHERWSPHPGIHAPLPSHSVPGAIPSTHALLCVTRAVPVSATHKPSPRQLFPAIACATVHKAYGAAVQNKTTLDASFAITVGVCAFVSNIIIGAICEVSTTSERAFYEKSPSLPLESAMTSPSRAVVCFIERNRCPWT